jgi:superfamily I DNA and/or RNA helicase
MMIDTSGCKMG